MSNRLSRRNGTGSAAWLLAPVAGISLGLWRPSASLAEGDPPRVAAEPVELEISPMAPAKLPLTYRLLPSAAELNPGDAAPVYLRMRHETRDDVVKAIEEKFRAWHEIPLAEIPIAEARGFLDGFRTKLLTIAARRERCDWNYTIAEQKRDIIQMVLPDAQEMRMWSRLLTVKTRAEIADRRFGEAIEEIETGIAFGRHVAEGPFIVNALIGMAIDGQALDRVQELIAQPGAPNLYWALTALPTPLIDLRRSLEIEQNLGENMVPELEEIDAEHATAEWSILLEKMDRNLRRLTQKLTQGGDGDAVLKARIDVPLATLKDELREPANRWIREDGGFNEAQVGAMTEDERIARYIAGIYRERRDALFRAGYLRYPESTRFLEEAEASIQSLKGGPLGVFAAMFPTLGPALGAGARLDRRVAALRVVEAIRAYAASHDGRLPDTLDAITGLPIPGDPVTGKPFGYRKEGESATISSPAVAGNEKTALELKLAIRR